MGLDMYLSVSKYIPKTNWDNQEPVVTEQYKTVVNAAGLQEIQSNDFYGAEVKVNVAYWRKCNQIHKWFVDNIQNSNDNCKPHYVNREQLEVLLKQTKLALLHKDPTILPPQEGFFFGSTDIDEWYWDGLKQTVNQLEKVLSFKEAVDFEYQSSW